MNKTFYMTYKKDVPSKVFNRWLTLNPSYKIDFSLDKDCISFLEKNFNKTISDRFCSIKKGMFKADLWRLCKLYKNAGVYADVDLVPYLNIDNLDKSIDFYSCLSTNGRSIFQAFIVNFSQPYNPILFVFLLSFLLNNPIERINGPTYDMYNCLKYILNVNTIHPQIKYRVSEVKIKVNIGNSNENIKIINLYYFPDNLQYTIRLCRNIYKDRFNFKIKDNFLIIKRLDSNSGWGHNHSIDICFHYNASFFFFQESKNRNGRKRELANMEVKYFNRKILDSRDEEYLINGGW